MRAIRPVASRIITPRGWISKLALGASLRFFAARPVIVKRTRLRAPAEGSQSLKSKHIALLTLLPFLVALAVYANTAHHAFVFDDFEIILDNPLIGNFDRLSKFALFLQEPWRSVTQLSYAMTRYFFGFDPKFYHGLNILVHGLNSVLVYFIALVLAKRWLPAGRHCHFALAASLIFAVHPLHSEAVAYIWGGSSSLCAFFYFSTILLVLIGQTSNGRRRHIWQLLALLSGVLAWRAKEEAITLPIVISGLFVLTGSWRIAAGMLVIPVLLVASKWADLGRLYTRTMENQALVAAGLERTLPPDVYFLTHLKESVFYYLCRFVFPLDLNAEPQVEPVKHLLDPLLVLSVLILGGLVLWGVSTARKNPIVSFAILTLLMSPLISYAVMPLADVVAEHRVYIAGLGFSLLTAWFLTRKLRFTFVTLSAISLVMGVLTIERNKIWKNSLTLWKDVVAKSPRLARPHVNLAVAYEAHGRPDAALAEYRQALSINPRLSPAYVNMGAIYLLRNELTDCENALRKAAELSPSLPAPYIHLAILSTRKNSPHEALDFVDKAISLGDSFVARLTRGDVLYQMGRYDEALHEYDRAARLGPNLPEVRAKIDARLKRLGKGGPIR